MTTNAKKAGVVPIPPTTTKAEWDNSVSLSENIKPVIDSDGVEYNRLNSEWFDLYLQKKAICDKYGAMLRDEIAPLESAMLDILQRQKVYAPKPRCFGVRDDLDLPECEDCKFGKLCFAEMRRAWETGRFKV